MAVLETQVQICGGSGVMVFGTVVVCHNHIGNKHEGLPFDISACQLDENEWNALIQYDG